jgi:hypothetical protein
MGSLRFGAEIFQVYVKDHLPRHVHARYSGIIVIIEIWPGGARLGRRADRITPRNAKRIDVACILKVARTRQAELNRLWEETHD